MATITQYPSQSLDGLENRLGELEKDSPSQVSGGKVNSHHCRDSDGQADDKDTDSGDKSEPKIEIIRRSRTLEWRVPCIVGG